MVRTEPPRVIMGLTVPNGVPTLFQGNYFFKIKKEKYQKI